MMRGTNYTFIYRFFGVAQISRRHDRTHGFYNQLVDWFQFNWAIKEDYYLIKSIKA